MDLVVRGRDLPSSVHAQKEGDLKRSRMHAQAARGEPLQFSLMVPGRGSVAGVLRYYPFEAERETLPAPEAGSGRAAEPLTTYSLTQPPPSQAPPPGATQASDGARWPQATMLVLTCSLPTLDPCRDAVYTPLTGELLNCQLGVK